MGWLKAFIPQHLPNERLLDILDILTYLKITKRIIRANRRANAETLTKAFSSRESFHMRKTVLAHIGTANGRACKR